jgi:hypothetical protein
MAMLLSRLRQRHCFKLPRCCRPLDLAALAAHQGLAVRGRAGKRWSKTLRTLGRRFIWWGHARRISGLTYRRNLETRISDLLDHGGKSFQARTRRICTVAHACDGMSQHTCRIGLWYSRRIEPSGDGMSETMKAKSFTLQSNCLQPLGEVPGPTDREPSPRLRD